MPALYLKHDSYVEKYAVIILRRIRICVWSSNGGYDAEQHSIACAMSVRHMEHVNPWWKIRSREHDSIRVYAREAVLRIAATAYLYRNYTSSRGIQ